MEKNSHMYDDKLISEFEKVIGYKYKNKKYIHVALTHSSFANEKKLSKSQCNERMEFLGDAVLELIMSEYLYSSMKNVQEGELTRNRASIVCEPTLDLCAREIGLDKYIYLGKGEQMHGGRKRASIVSDAFEAVIGSIYLDGGFTSAKEFVEKFVIDGIEEKSLFYDSKTILQEIVQGKQLGTIRYEIVKESGPDHAKIFDVDVLVNDKKVASGEGTTKKAAQQQAAYKAILRYRQIDQSCQNKE